MEHLLKWLYTVCASTLVFIIFYLVSLSKGRKKRLPPGPRWSFPVIGHLHLLTKSPLHRTLHSLSTQYGPVIGLKLGNRYAVVVSSADAMEECFGKNDVVLADRIPNILAAKHLHYDYTNMVTSNYGDHWRNTRRILNQEVFCVSRQNMFQSLRQDDTKSMIKSLFHMTRQGMQKVEMRSRFQEMTFNIIVGIVTGKRYYGAEVQDLEEAKEFHAILKQVFELTVAPNVGDVIPFFRLIDLGGYEKKMLKLKKSADEFLQNLIDETRAKDGAVVDSMLRNMLLMQEADPASISDKAIKGNVLMLVGAATDPTADTIEWAMSALLNDPEKLKKAQDEIDAVISPGRLVEERDLLKLTYLQAIINETLRMYPDAPLMIPHYSSGECTIQGFHLPRGTAIFCNVWAIQQDPNIWEDPLSFMPERFENLEENLANKLFPFGVGRRSCPGASMARKVIALALASLLQCFDWGRIGEEKVDMRECDRPTMFKRTPLEAMCQPRYKMMDVLSNL